MLTDKYKRTYIPFTIASVVVGIDVLNAAATSCLIFIIQLFSCLKALFMGGRVDGAEKLAGAAPVRQLPLWSPTQLTLGWRDRNILRSIIMIGMSLSARESRAIQRASKIIERAFSQKNNQQFCNSIAAKEFFKIRLATLDREEFHALWLDSQYRFIATETISIGTLSSASVYPREVLKSAIKLNASAVIFAHNHPTGTENPSAADIDLTSAICNALHFIDVTMLDHVIVAGVNTFSFSEAGMINGK